MADALPAPGVVRMRVLVEGTVQGVGFRPYVFGLARHLAVGGFVGNDGRGVVIEVEGNKEAVRRFLTRLRLDAPPLATIDRITHLDVSPVGDQHFSIRTSTLDGPRQVPVVPDAATCPDCLREMGDPTDRRYGYPFVNCTNCGPRYSIVRDVPYDRASTTMAAFEMCPDCAGEYDDPHDRRFHAQPLCCAVCGPTLRLTWADGRDVPGEPLAAAVEMLGQGDVLAIKGLGGYHLATDATDAQATRALRSRKHREDKPFAVMVADLPTAHRLCEIDAEEATLLEDPSRPIVLLRHRPGTPIAEAVAPGNRLLGLLLPYTPLHHLLLESVTFPVVLTSGNVSDEPIAYGDQDARDRLASVADAFLHHDRAIQTRVDDSVAQVVGGRPVILRRSRGQVPRPLRLAEPTRRPVLACGAELKNTIGLAKGTQAYLSQHLGDLKNYETLQSFVTAIAHLGALFDVVPEVVAHDLHPDYLSTTYARDLLDVDLVAVQHHHAHIASCLTDNGEVGPVIGLALDGTGYGTDGTVWGGEVLHADLRGFERLGHFEHVPMPGGAAAVRQPWRMAAAHLDVGFDGAVPGNLGVRSRNRDRWDEVVAVGRAGVNSPHTSSAGRFFDAVAAMVGVRDIVSYEGQAAVELEQIAAPGESAGYPVEIVDGAPFRLATTPIVRAIADDLATGIAPGRIAARFHRTVVDLLIAASRRARELTDLDTVALSGGVFQNRLLTAALVSGLEDRGFRVLTHRQVPPNDGGISLGQLSVAAAHDRRD